MDDGQLQWALRQRTPRSSTRTLGAVLEGLAGTVWFKRHQHLGKVVEALTELLPAGMSEHVAVEGFKRNTLHLQVDSAAHRYELELAKRDLLDALNQRVSGVFIREIRLTLGKPADPDNRRQEGAPDGDR